MLTANDVIDILDLVPHPTCGMVKQTFISNIMLPRDVLPNEFNGSRTAGGVMYFMVTPTTQLKLHKIHSDQMYHFYLGEPLEVLLLYPDGKSEIKLIGQDLKAGMSPQLFIPADTYHIGRLYNNSNFALLATSEWIGVQPQDVIVPNPVQLMNEYPHAKVDILAFTGQISSNK